MLHMPMGELFYRHFAMESVPDPLIMFTFPIRSVKWLGTIQLTFCMLVTVGLSNMMLESWIRLEATVICCALRVGEH